MSHPMHAFGCLCLVKPVMCSKALYQTLQTYLIHGRTLAIVYSVLQLSYCNTKACTPWSHGSYATLHKQEALTAKSLEYCDSKTGLWHNSTTRQDLLRCSGKTNRHPTSHEPINMSYGTVKHVLAWCLLLIAFARDCCPSLSRNVFQHERCVAHLDEDKPGLAECGSRDFQGCT